MGEPHRFGFGPGQVAFCRDCVDEANAAIGLGQLAGAVPFFIGPTKPGAVLSRQRGPGVALMRGNTNREEGWSIGHLAVTPKSLNPPLSSVIRKRLRTE
jgi:hypothetical protein